MENQEKYICENCGKEHDGSYGSGRFCSQKCARAFSTKFNRKEINEKVSKTLKSKHPEKPIKYCKDCNAILNHRNKTGYCKKCSNSHADRSWMKDEKYRKHISEIIKEKYKNGEHNGGWRIRNKGFASFAELFFIKVLDSNKIDYEFNKYYEHKFLDFFIYVDEFRKIDLEIDGKQHKNRIKEDIERDKFLSEHGFLIHRIEWNEIVSQAGKDLMKKKIDNFLNFYKTLM